MTDTQYLEKIIGLSGKKKEYLADKCGITRQTLTNKINNRTPFMGDEIGILCTELKIQSAKEIHRIFFANKVE